jgi:dUTP pyrophosphatase
MFNMQVAITRIDPTLPLPAYQTSGAAAFDIYSRIDITIPPHTLAKIPTNLIIATPPDHMLVVAARSSTPGRKGLLVPHGIGIIDSDFRGPNDELLFQVYNFTENSVILERGERIGQGIFVPISRAEFVEHTVTTSDTSRGGFGSTGTA